MSALSALKHVFPPPQYITLPNVGVDISDTSLKYIQFRRRHAHDKNLELYKWGDIEIPSGVVERGTVHDTAQLTNILREFQKQTGAQYIRVSLPEERAYLFETSIKRDMPFKEIRGHIEFKLEENVPLSPRDVYFDYDIVETKRKEGDLQISVAVYSKETINGYYEACIGSHLMPLSFEIEAQAIARAAVATGSTGTYMIIDFGKTRTGVGIVHEGVLMYTSTIDIGGRDLSAAMKNVLGPLPEDEYTKIKNTDGLQNRESNKVYHVLLSAVSNIKDELETRIQYWGNHDTVQKEGATIEKIILCGGSSNLAGLPEYLRRELKIETERAEVWKNSFSLESFIPPITKRYSYGYATAIGLALKDHLIHD